MRPDRTSVMALVEAAYRPSLTHAAWCDELAAAALAFDQGLGTFVALEGLSADARQRYAFASVGNPALAGFLAHVGAHADPIADLFTSRLALTGSLRDIVARSGDEAARGEVERFFDALAPLGIDDLWGIGTSDASGLTLSLCWPTRGRALPRGFEHWARTALHLSAGTRLRANVMRHGLAPTAVLSPDGKVLDATGMAERDDVRERLSQGVRAAEEARGRARGDGERALSLWQALTAGRFSLVDRVDSDGRRFVLALPNALAAPGPFELSPRERDVVRWAVDGASNKEAAYALGLSVGGFSAQLTRAMRKLKVHNRSELQVLVMRTRDVSEPSADASAARHGYLAVPLSAPAPADDVRLTDHQRALLALLAEGTSNQTIAERLGISPHTVRNRVAALCTKFGARSRAELVRLFARR